MRLKASVQRTSWIMIFVLLGFGATSVQAQQEKETPKSEGAASGSGLSGKLVQRIFDVKFADVDRLAETLRLFGPVYSNRDLKVITVSGSPELVAAVEDAIRRFDVPSRASRNIELTAYLLVASDQATSKGTPSDLDGVVAQLKSIFKYQGFHLLDILVIRSRDGRDGRIRGIVPATQEEYWNTTCDFFFKSASITSDDKVRIIRIDGLEMEVTVPMKMTKDTGGTPHQSKNTIINTNIDVREGQKVVVGKATMNGSHDALFLVLTAKVVD